MKTRCYRIRSPAARHWADPSGQNLRDGEKAVIVGKSVLPAAESLLHDLSPGSRIRKAPEQKFPKVTLR